MRLPDNNNNKRDVIGHARVSFNYGLWWNTKNGSEI